MQSKKYSVAPHTVCVAPYNTMKPVYNDHLMGYFSAF